VFSAGPSHVGGYGVEHLIIQLPNVHEIGPIETVGEEIIPAVAEL
jgi:hypothetical protein